MDHPLLLTISDLSLSVWAFMTVNEFEQLANKSFGNPTHTWNTVHMIQWPFEKADVTIHVRLSLKKGGGLLSIYKGGSSLLNPRRREWAHLEATDDGEAAHKLGNEAVVDKIRLHQTPAPITLYTSMHPIGSASSNKSVRSSIALLRQWAECTNTHAVLNLPLNTWGSSRQ